MPVQVTVGPPIITINQGNTFMVTDLNGEIRRESEQGVFYGDTRFVSHYAIYAGGLPWVRLSSSPTSYYSALLHLDNPVVPTEEGDIPAGTVKLTVRRAVSEGIHEDLEITNFNMRPVRFNLELEVRSDFADLFEVKEHKFVQRGRIDTTWDAARSEATISYRNRDFHRTLVYHSLSSDSPMHMVNGRATFEVDLEPGATWRSCHHFTMYLGEQGATPEYRCFFAQQDQNGEVETLKLQEQWRASVTKLETPNEDINRTYLQAVEDMGALRLYSYDLGPSVWLPAAGVPWFVTVFGRDSLVVSLQNVIVSPDFAVGALRTLARFQATELDPWRDAEPGKILHEMRFGELAHFHKIPHTPYYGTADATPLYLIALHSAWKWTGDDTLLRQYYDTALRCLDWIDRYGDLDGDGLQEYQTRSTKGYENMGWKDAGDAVVYPDGSQVKQPKALCELQAYVFEAWLRMAEVFDALDEPHRATDLRRKAADLQRRFEEKFWCEDIGFYAFGLDPNKQPIKTIASNPGHCLTSGIVRPDRAQRVADRLLQPDMWTGWGIRTLSSLNPAYNPLDYQRGAVWPHDNGIIALGFKRYGLTDETAAVAHDIFAAAACFTSYRLPELYAGIQREPGAFPVQYLGANVPQAWAAGSIFMLLQALLGIQADAPHGRLTVDPSLPDWLPEVRLSNLRIGKARLDLRFWREGPATRWEVAGQEGDIEVVHEPMRPWDVTASAPAPQRTPQPPADQMEEEAA